MSDQATNHRTSEEEARVANQLTSCSVELVQQAVPPSQAQERARLANQPMGSTLMGAAAANRLGRPQVITYLWPLV